MKIKLIVIFLISFITISSQNMLNYEVDLPEVELSLTKPQNKFVAGKQVNERAIVFIAGATLTTISTVQIVRARNSNFRFDNPNVTIPIGPHGMLFGVGLFAMSFSFVIS
jgi:hypothetical protein